MQHVFRLYLWRKQLEQRHMPDLLTRDPGEWLADDWDSLFRLPLSRALCHRQECNSTLCLQNPACVARKLWEKENERKRMRVQVWVWVHVAPPLPPPCYGRVQSELGAVTPWLHSTISTTLSRNLSFFYTSSLPTPWSAFRWAMRSWGRMKSGRHVCSCCSWIITKCCRFCYCCRVSGGS